MEFLLTIFLEVLVLLLIVPAATSGGVAVRQGGLLRGLLIVICIGFLNLALWFGITLLTLGTALLAQVLTFGLLGLLVNALAIRLAGHALADAFYVRSYGSALIAAIVMVLSNMVIQALLL